MIYLHRRRALALLVSTNRAMRRPLHSGTSDRTVSTFELAQHEKIDVVRIHVRRQSRQPQYAVQHLKAMHTALLGIDIQDFTLAVGQFRPVVQHLLARQQGGHDGAHVERLLGLGLTDGRTEIAHRGDGYLIHHQYLWGKDAAVGGLDLQMVKEAQETLTLFPLFRCKLVPSALHLCVGYVLVTHCRSLSAACEIWL